VARDDSDGGGGARVVAAWVCSSGCGFWSRDVGVSLWVLGLGIWVGFDVGCWGFWFRVGWVLICGFFFFFFFFVCDDGCGFWCMGDGSLNGRVGFTAVSGGE
jgi:hypothetical protein